MSWIDKYYAAIETGLAANITDSRQLSDAISQTRNGHLFDMQQINIIECEKALKDTVSDMIKHRMFEPPYDDILMRLRGGNTFKEVFLVVCNLDNQVSFSGFYLEDDNSVKVLQDLHFLSKTSGSIKVDNKERTYAPFDIEKDEDLALARTYLTALALIYSRSTEKESVVISEELNAKRERNGKSRLKDYHIVRLPNDYYKEHDSGLISEDGEKRYIRAHWRRGHIRRARIKGGIRNIFIAPVLVCGDREFVAKHYEYKKVGSYGSQNSAA